METVKILFGKYVSVLFSSLNVLQLVGWTAVMIAVGATAANAVLNIGGGMVWLLIIGALIIVWILIEIKSLGKINIVAMSGLFILIIVMSIVVFRGDISSISEGGLTVGAAVELSVAMPLSWLPVISDYTRTAKKKQMATLASSTTYFVVSY